MSRERARLLLLVVAATLIAAVAIVLARGRGPISPLDGRVAVLGHVERAEDRLVFAWPLTGVELFVQGTRVAFDVETERFDPSSTQNTWVDVFVDDDVAVTRELPPGASTVEVPLSAARVHRIRFVKRTEAALGTTSLIALHVDGALERAHAPRRPLIEFVGDSISVGFGVEGTNGTCRFSAETENASKAYPALVTEALHGRQRMYAWSGKGVVRNADPSDGVLAGELYGVANPLRSPLTAELGREPANMVVVNLGTNDLAAGIPSRRDFQTAMFALLARVRVDQPNAKILVVVSPMAWDEPGVPRRTFLREALADVVRVRLENGDRRIELLELWTDASEGMGCQMHPSAASNARFAREIAAALRGPS